MQTPTPFSGWRMVTLLFVMYASTTISTNCLALFFPELMREFGWTHDQVSAPVGFYFIYIALASPVAGLLLARFRPRTLMLAGMLLSTASVLAYANLRSFVQYHVVYFALSIAITLSGLLPSMVILNAWFERRRGLATGVFLIGSSAGGILFPQVASYFIKTADWRTAAYAVAGLGAVISLVPWIFLKNRPEDLGQVRDGQPLPEIGTPTGLKLSGSLADPEIRLTDLLRQPVFYLLLFITAAFWFCGFSVLQHLRLYLQDYGFDVQRAANASSLFFVFSILGKISFGYVSDQFNKLTILVGATACLILGIICLRLVPLNGTFVYAFAVIYGVGYSGAFAMIQLTVADLYRGKSFGKVLGVVNAFDSLGGFAGIKLLGYLRTTQGSYLPALNLLLAVCAAALVGAILLRNFQKMGTRIGQIRQIFTD